MITDSSQLREQVKNKARELGVTEEMIACALNILSRNRNLVNALDNKSEMDEYIYRAIIKEATDNRKKMAETALESPDANIRLQAEKDLSILTREELMSDAYYRAVLPIIARVVNNEPILRLHVEEASEIVLKLADCKRRYRATSLTEIIVSRCGEELESFSLLAEEEETEP